MSALSQTALATCTDGLTPDEIEFWDRAYLAVLPFAMQCQGWKIGEKPITSGDDRAYLAGRWADAAVRERRSRMDELK
ncbi:hypothetical protein [Caballeronia zhejiangensis]|uniref:hypothetical protein n=1 Tax=Caballeronia zhejiangensis TaxID=871203 RepID=UPI0012679FF4|nr:hypothetical protein [Caballeronia zhejiangensis]